MALLATNDRATLRQFLVARFSLSELKDLVFNLGIGSDVIAGDNTPDVSRNLIEYCERRDKISCLLVEVLKVRPDPAVEQMLAATSSCTPDKKVEIIVHGATVANLQEVLAELAKKLNLTPDQLSLVAAAPGSLRLLVSVPEEAAGRLLAMGPLRLADGKYEVASVREFGALSNAEQNAWRNAARSKVPAQVMPDTTGTGTAVLTAAETGIPGIIKLLLIIAVLGVAGAATGIIAAPALTIVNNCGRAIPLPADVPIIGSSLPQGQSTYKLWPGDYSITQSGRQIRVTGPLGLDTGFFQPGTSFSVSEDGRRLDINRPLSVSIGSHIQIDISCAP